MAKKETLFSILNNDGETKEVSKMELRLDLSDIFIDPTNNARDTESSAYAEESIGSLCAQIKFAEGLMIPLIVIEIEPSQSTEFKKYILQSGYRRVTALEKLAEEEGEAQWVQDIPCRLGEITSHGKFSLFQVMENLREDLGPLELATGLQRAIEESGGKLTQREIARGLGMDESKVSRVLKLLALPEEIQKMVATGDLSMTNALTLLSDDYDLDAADRLKCAKLGCKYSGPAFKALMDANHGKKEEDADGGSTSSKKAPVVQMVKKKTVETIIMPFLVQQLAGIEAVATDDKPLEKKFTEADIISARMDAINTMFVGKDTTLNKDLEPFKAQIEAQEKQEKAQEGAKKAYEKFVKSIAKKIKDLLAQPINEDGERPYPSLSSAIAKIGGDLKKMTGDDAKKLGFKYHTEKLEDYLKAGLAQFKKNRQDAIERAKKAKEKKAAEKAAKEAAK